MKNEKIGYIDALKGLAIIGITVAHSGANLIDGWVGRLSCLGPTTVVIFLMLSGMLTEMSLDKHFGGEHISFKSLLKWYKARLIRLLPLFYIALFLSLLTGSWSQYWLGEDKPVTVLNVIAHMFMVHGFFPHYVNSLMGLEWYVGVLFIFILISPLLHRFINTWWKAVMLLLVVFFANPLIETYMFNHMPIMDDSIVYVGYIYSTGPFPNFTFFVFGMVLYFLFKKLNSVKLDDKKRCAISYGLLCLSFVLIVLQYLYVILGSPFTMNESYALIYSLIIISQMVRRSPVIDNCVFRFFGKYSYGIYLFQYIVFNMYDKLILYHGRGSWTIKFLVGLMVLLGVSFLLTKGVDKCIKQSRKSV